MRAPPTKVGCDSVRISAFVAHLLKVNVGTARPIVDVNGLFCLFAIMAFAIGEKRAQTIYLTFISGIGTRECG